MKWTLPTHLPPTDKPRVILPIFNPDVGWLARKIMARTPLLHCHLQVDKITLLMSTDLRKSINKATIVVKSPHAWFPA